MTASSSGPHPRVSHLVLNVRDIDASHAFYTDALGFQQCGELDPRSIIGKMRFYRGSEDHHHDLALVQTQEPVEGEVDDWTIFRSRVGINHIAIEYGDREGFLTQLNRLRDAGVEFRYRGNHGMTHSVYVQDPDGNGIEVIYDLPSEVWEGDVNAALNYFEQIPVDSEAAMQDSDDYVRFTGAE
jgi:catechol-2,3-dioxygenase